MGLVQWQLSVPEMGVQQAGETKGGKCMAGESSEPTSRPGRPCGTGAGVLFKDTAGFLSRSAEGRRRLLPGPLPFTSRGFQCQLLTVAW